MGILLEPEELFWRYAHNVLERMGDEARKIEAEEIAEHLWNDGPEPACFRERGLAGWTAPPLRSPYDKARW